MRPHRRQPSRLLCPWDSPGKNTGVGCHFLLQCMKMKSESEVTPSCPTLWDPMDCSLPCSSAHRIFQARVLEWVATAFSVRSYEPCENLILVPGERKWKSLCHLRLFATPWSIQSGNSPGQNTAMGSRFLPQGIFPTQGSNSDLLPCRQILYHLSYQGSPVIVYPVQYFQLSPFK